MGLYFYAYWDVLQSSFLLKCLSNFSLHKSFFLCSLIIYFADSLKTMNYFVNGTKCEFVLNQEKSWKNVIIGELPLKFIVACITVVNMLRSVFISCLMCRKIEGWKRTRRILFLSFLQFFTAIFSHCFSFHQQNAWCTCEMGCDDVDMMIIILFRKLRFSS